MNLIRNFSLAAMMSIVFTVAAFAGTTVTSPVNGSNVSSTFRLTMKADYCSDRPVVHVGYSFDSNPQTSTWAATYIDGPVTGPKGWHKLHVKVWNNAGAVCITDVAVNIGAGYATTSSVAPSSANNVSNIDSQGNWTSTHDYGTAGYSSGWTGTRGSPSISGTSRQFTATMSKFGAHRFAVHFGDDRNSQNFVYDTYVYIANSAEGIANLEFDLNQTMPNGETVIMGFQCDGWSHTWDYTVNAGSPQSPKDRWVHSYAHCDLHSWGANQWHHLQISYSHTPSGWVTYKSVWLDGNRQDINVTAFSSFALGWGSSLLANFQVDGSSYGTTYANVYMDKMTVYHW